MAVLGGCSGQARLQEVRHELIAFRIPADWSVVTTSSGARVCTSRHGTAVLRLDVLSAQKAGCDRAEDVLRIGGEARGAIESLPNGNAMTESEKASSEDGKPLRTWSWHLANVPAPACLRLAVFSLTLAADEADTAAARELVATVRGELAQGRFAPLQEFERR
jgi:hypothetical protein